VATSPDSFPVCSPDSGHPTAGSLDPRGSLDAFAVSLGAAIDLFIAAKAAEGASARTLEWYRMITGRAVRRFGSDRPVDRLTAAELRAWLLELRESPRVDCRLRPWPQRLRQLVRLGGAGGRHRSPGAAPAARPTQAHRPIQQRRAGASHRARRSSRAGAHAALPGHRTPTRERVAAHRRWLRFYNQYRPPRRSTDGRP
jgi:hypothetical protein